MDLEQIIQEELEAVLKEKKGEKDACYHKVKFIATKCGQVLTLLVL